MSKHLREEEFIPYLDGCLSAAEQARLDAHLVACATCRAQLNELQAVAGVLGEWKAVEPSTGFDAALRARLAQERSPRAGGALLWPAYAAVLVMALLVAGAIALWQWVPSEPVPTPQVAQTPPQQEVAPPLQPSVSIPEGDELAVLDNPVLLENYELLEEFDVLFEPLSKEEEKL